MSYIEAAREGQIVPILVGPEAKICAVAEEEGVDLADIELVDDAEYSHQAAERGVELCRVLGIEKPKVAILSATELVNPATPPPWMPPRCARWPIGRQIAGGQLEGPCVASIWCCPWLLMLLIVAGRWLLCRRFLAAPLPFEALSRWARRGVAMSAVRGGWITPRATTSTSPNRCPEGGRRSCLFL